MDSTNDITIGQVVRSKAGRDKGRIFLVVEVVDREYLYLVDGDLRKLENPKKKKIKHLSIYKTVLPELKDKLDKQIKIDNAFIRKLLETFNNSF